MTINTHLSNSSETWERAHKENTVISLFRKKGEDNEEPIDQSRLDNNKLVVKAVGELTDGVLDAVTCLVNKNGKDKILLQYYIQMMFRPEEDQTGTVMHGKKIDAKELKAQLINFLTPHLSSNTNLQLGILIATGDSMAFRNIEDMLWELSDAILTELAKQVYSPHSKLYRH